MGDDDDSRAPRLRPITSIGALLAWEPGSRPEDLYCRSSVPLRNDLPRSDPSSPRVLACHDFKGGYGVEALACGVFERVEASSSPSCSRPSTYRFGHWGSIDSFIYFSHGLVTIPPPSCIDAAHDNGVLCLGTFIFEHSEGERAAMEAFGSSDAAAAEATGTKLAEIARWFGFDGWLFNVEVDFERMVSGKGGGGGETGKGVSTLVENCLVCLRRTRELLSSSPSNTCTPTASPSTTSASLVLWYDAVTCDRGDLSWQDALSESNARFFLEADGIFTNYCWSASTHLRGSVELADSLASLPSPRRSRETRGRCEVWAGADAFGRGSYGGEGGRGVAAAARAAAREGASLAVFAPGWVFEAFEGGGCPAWRARADDFWSGVDEAYEGRRKRVEGPIAPLPLPLPFYASFAGGAGHGWWSPGDGSFSSSRSPCRSPASSRCASKLVGGRWFHLSISDAPAPARQRWGAVSAALFAVAGNDGGEGGRGGGAKEGDRLVRLSLVVAEAAVVRAGIEGDCEVFGAGRSRCGRRLGAPAAFDGGGALAVAVAAFGPLTPTPRSSSFRRPPPSRKGRFIDFVLFGDASSAPPPSSRCPSEEEEEREDEDENDDDDGSLSVRAWVAEEGEQEGGEKGGAASRAFPDSAISLSLVVRGRMTSSDDGESPSSPSSSSLLQLPLPRSFSSAPPPSSPSSSSSSRWRKHELSFSNRELRGGKKGSLASLELRLTIGDDGDGSDDDGDGRKGPRLVAAATLGAVSVSTSSLRAAAVASPVAKRVRVRRGGVGGGYDVEWGSSVAGNEEDGGGRTIVERWELFAKKEGNGGRGDDSSPRSASFLGASRARRWWLAGDQEEEMSGSRVRLVEPGDELIVRAVFADGSRERLDEAGRSVLTAG